jgi:nicotinate-nucleotide adenylyltransferase
LSRRRVGIFGGTFDPPHVGHLILAMEASDQLKLDQVLWVLAPDPPHKQDKNIAPLDIRIRMVKEAIDADPLFALSYADINRPGPHYVVDTMHILRREHPDAELVFLMGGDSLRNLLHWYEPAKFIAACDTVGVMRRPGEIIDLDPLRSAIPTLFDKLEFIDAPLLEISSNQIRQLVANKQPFRYYLPTGVFHLVSELGLYQEGDDHG